MIVAARGDQGHSAGVLDAIGVAVHALVQLRGRTQRERAEKCSASEYREKGASVIV